jgi:catechol 2,3-dioxygenase
MKDTCWYRDTLGFRFMEYTVPDDIPDLVVFTQTTTNEKSHDLGFVADFSGVPGRLNHVAFFVPEVKDLLRAADILLEAGFPMEYGPGQHGMGEQHYLYFREPGGMRIEINSGGYRNYIPDWEPVKWVPSQGSNSMYRNAAMVDSMTESFPPADGLSFPEPVAQAGRNPHAPQSANFFSQHGQG